MSRRLHGKNVGEDFSQKASGLTTPKNLGWRKI